MTASEIAAEWISEFNNGIDGTSVRPGFIKLAVNAGELRPVDRKLLEAAALTHLATSLVIAIHTRDNVAAAEAQLDILHDHGVAPSAWIWTHAQHAAASDSLIAAARRGAWISLDGLKTEPAQNETLIAHLLALREAGLLKRVLLSHDGNGFPSGGPIRPFDTLATSVLPQLRALGFSETEIRQLTVANPADAFTLSLRRI